ncbi:MAG: glycosyltransferase [Bacteriovorax sp.]|nr:glycosyltransferase [Bacteriovorax sp.]
MKIVFQHNGVLPVLKYGGIERIIFWHMKELARMGHKVILIGHAESSVREHGIELIALQPDVDWTTLVPKDTDIIHLFYNYKFPGNIPTINTIQGNGKIGENFIKNTVFVSKKHAAIHGSDQFIYNALDLEEYPFKLTEKKWDHFLFLAKASWRVKNLAHAVKTCRKSNKHLHIAGGKWWGISRYIHSFGMVGGEEKLNIIRSCDALLFPVRWHEPFGIAIIEAMSQGLPVVGSPFGSLPELITSEVGFIVNNHDELLMKLKNPGKVFNAQVIRKYVEDNFAINKHAESYLVLYQKVMTNEELNQQAPTYQFNIRAEELLPF